MEKCKTEQFEDEITAENVDAQMPNENEAIGPVKKVANPWEKYKCSKCPVYARGKFALNVHKEIHKRRGNPEYPLNCEYCDASFANHNRIAFVVHQRAHDGVKTQPKVVCPNAGIKRGRPPANNDGAGAEGDNDAEVEIIEPPKKRVGRPRKLVPPRRVAAVHNELLVPDVANANAPGPAGPSSISTIVKECAKSNGVLHNIELRDNDAVCKIGKIEFR